MSPGDPPGPGQPPRDRPRSRPAAQPPAAAVVPGGAPPAPESRSSVTDPSDGRQLMLAVAADEPGAFERLVASYETRVKAAVSRSIADRSSVDDLAQEVFLRIFRARHRYQPTARFETFLYRVIFNLCVNHTQFRARRRSASLDAPTGAEGEGSWEPADERADPPDVRAQQHERAAMVRAAVDRLPDSQRQALVLNRFEGQGYEEIGQIMELSLQAVKSLLWRARENLRKELLEILGGHEP